MPLGELNCRNAKPKERPYKLTDGEGLYLQVQPNGSRLWRMAYRFQGRQKTLAFGAYPYVSLAEARKRRTDAKTLLASGHDPAAAKVEGKPSEQFEAVARRWHESESRVWTPKHVARVMNRLERDAFPQLGARPINQIEPPEVLEALRKVEARGALDVAKRLRQEISAVFRFAIAEGRAKFNPAADVGGALKPQPKVRHRAKVGTHEVAKLVRDIDAYDGEPVTRLALLFTLHTFLRTNEVRFATWAELDGVDLDGAAPTWRIPGERMKMEREHVVPLTPAAVALLKEAGKYRDGPYIFPGNRGKRMSENTMLFALYRMGYHSRQTVHGFRGLASTILNEAGWNSDWVERQLAHVEEDNVRGAYNAAEWLPGRRKMMQWWSDFLEGKVEIVSEGVTPLAA